jgi:hypothetical protein
MKINWGTGIFITIVVFLIGMISLVIISSMQPLNLVTPDYYPKAIDYQSQIDRIARTNALSDKMGFSQDEEFIYIEFPMVDSLISPEGKVLVFFPRDNNLDHEFEIEVNDSLFQIIPKEGLMQGWCVVKVNWVIDSLEYYVEEDFMIE